MRRSLLTLTLAAALALPCNLGAQTNGMTGTTGVRSATDDRHGADRPAAGTTSGAAATSPGVQPRPLDTTPNTGAGLQALDPISRQPAPIIGARSPATDGPTEAPRVVSAMSFHEMDVNQDRRLSAVEVQVDPALATHFNRLDRSNDGWLQEVEYLSYGKDPDTVR